MLQDLIDVVSAITEYAKIGQLFQGWCQGRHWPGCFSSIIALYAEILYIHVLFGLCCVLVPASAMLRTLLPRAASRSTTRPSLKCSAVSQQPVFCLVTCRGRRGYATEARLSLSARSAQLKLVNSCQRSMILSLLAGALEAMSPPSKQDKKV